MVTKGLVRTNDNCVGCNRCIGTCSCIGAMTASTGRDGRNIIHVDGRKCIACGACFDACEHNAREFSDDTAAFFEALKKGERISLLIAPAFIANYPDEYGAVLGGLKKLGVNRMINVSFGADITTWGYLNYIKKQRQNRLYLPALPRGGKLYRAVYTRAYPAADTRPEPAYVRGHICLKGHGDNR